MRTFSYFTIQSESGTTYCTEQAGSQAKVFGCNCLFVIGIYDMSADQRETSELDSLQPDICKS